MPRSTRRTTSAKPILDKENHDPSQRESATTASSRKARHRLSTAELARLEDVFRQATHPSRQQKKDLAAELGMDYKTITIWFQNKRQTSKRGRPPVEGLEAGLGRTRAADSCLRSVSSPSHNTTLDVSDVGRTATFSSEDKSPENGLSTITSTATVKIKPLLDSLDAPMSRPREHPEPMEVDDETPIVKDIDLNSPWALSENLIIPAELNKRDPTAHQEQTKGKPASWKRIRTLEWACERQTRRRKMSREGYLRLGSEEVQDGNPDDTHMDSALVLLSLACLTRMRPSRDVIKGASLLLSFKHTWRRKEQVRFEATTK